MAIKQCDKLFSIMFVDMEGYTSKTAAQSRQEANAFVRLYGDLIEPSLKKYNGSRIKGTGDGLIAIFESSTDAVLSAIDMQKIFAIYDDEELITRKKMRVRVGLHTGEVNLSNGDIFGEAVNLAARVQEIAEAGEILTSETVYLTMNRNEAVCERVGKRRLKGVPQRIVVYRVLAGGEKPRRKSLRVIFLVALGLILTSVVLAEVFFPDLAEIGHEYMRNSLRFWSLGAIT